MASPQNPEERRGAASAEHSHIKDNKVMVTIRLDHDVIDWFRAQGRGYQTRINEALRLSMMDGPDTIGESGSESGRSKMIVMRPRDDAQD